MDFIKRIFGSSKEDCLTTTKGFQILLQATADAMDAREDGIKAGLISEHCETDEAIGVLYATYIFNLYEKKLSPIVAYRILEVYCRKIISEAYKLSYISYLRNTKNPDIDFSKNNIDTIMEVYPLACRGKEIGYKMHWNPFREPFHSLWNCGFENKAPEEALIKESFKIMLA